MPFYISENPSLEYKHCPWDKYNSRFQMKEKLNKVIRLFHFFSLSFSNLMISFNQNNIWTFLSHSITVLDCRVLHTHRHDFLRTLQLSCNKWLKENYRRVLKFFLHSLMSWLNLQTHNMIIFSTLSLSGVISKDFSKVLSSLPIHSRF